ncbi:MAG: PQQ-dependent sugar dehydrogenase [Candidatus Binatia bacterium]|nr:PQQ-dependent sugar dehydrogenase [Candidatus Binatia bacterium]
MSVRSWAMVALVALGIGFWACSHVTLPGGYVVNFPLTGGGAIPAEEIGRLRVPGGFGLTVFAEGIPNARMLKFTPAGDLLVSAPREGRVFLLERDENGDGRAEGKRVLLEDLDLPHGLALHDGWLYVAETGAVTRVRFDAETRTVTGTPEVVVGDVPPGGRHWTRTIGIGPDEKLYVSVGSSCNACIEEDARRAAITRYDLDGTNEQIYATGLRNAVGFAWQPATGALWSTDNNRDLLGDDFPPGELDEIVEGGFYGWPFANGDRVPDPDFLEGYEREIAASIPPAHDFAAHTAPLGITFYDGEAFPEHYRGAAFVALHGSWNRSRKIGYEVVAVFFGEDDLLREESFLAGLLDDDDVLGRPVDVAVGPDGALFVSDDFSGQIYRVAYGETPRAAVVPAAPIASGVDPLAGVGPGELREAQAAGASLWKDADCAACHGPDRTEGHRSLADLKARYTIDSLMRFLAAPQPPMPLYPLDEDQRRELSIYLFGRFS